MSNPSLRCVVASAWILAPLALAACPADPIASGDRTPIACTDDDFRTSEDQLQLSHSRSVDILFVIDNTATMAEEQVQLNAGVAALFERLDAAKADYRIAFTTTDNGNPWCPAGLTTPEGGKLVLSPCTERLGDFVFGDSVDVQDFACTEQCSLGAADLTIAPTTTSVDDSPAPRPWIERIAGRSNLPSTTDPIEAFKCFAPQGVNGCGFEAPLESLYLALARAQTNSEPSYGFMRADSVLAVVVLTDEADCSYNKEWAEIFDADGSKTFWSDPSAEFPSSAVCWNAGVACTGDPSGYDGCEPANWAPDGSEAANPYNAVMHPMLRYTDLLEGIESQKQELDASRELVFSLIAGVEGSGEDWSVSYADALDPAYQLGFGIGPGCTSADGQPAVPPVRLRALAETIDPLGLSSICESDFSAAMADLGDRITAQIQPMCMYKCVGDSDLSTPQLEPACTLEQNPPGSGSEDVVRIPECLRGPDGAYLFDVETGRYQLPDAAEVCMVTLVEDDISEACNALGSNVEFVLERLPGVAPIDGTSISVSCALSSCPIEDCPNLF